MSEPVAKKAKLESFQRSELDALHSQSREGYFGDTTAITGSNASGDPRIVLDERFGEPRSGSLTALSLSEAEVKKQLAGCAGRYEGRAVIVTGGARGIGEGIVRVFFEAGANVFVGDRDEARALALAKELNEGDSNAGRTVQVRKTDVSVVAELQALVDAAITAFGRIDCVINNAGWHPPHKAIDDFAVDDMQNLLQLNFISVFAMCKFALPHLRKTKGNIINMSSLVGVFGQSKATTYAATKGAVTSFTKALAIDEAAHQVRVNSVSPGNIWTPLWKAGADAEADPAAARAAGESVQVLKRMGSILETGRLCLCIASDLTFTTGIDHIQSGGAEIGYGIK